MIKKIIFGLGIAIIVAAAAFFIRVETYYPSLETGKTAGGFKRMDSMYLTMRDGVEIAVEYWLPSDYEKGDRIPTLIHASRYSRLATTYPIDFKTKIKLMLAGYSTEFVEYNQLMPDAGWANENGYAVVFIDARGSSASFGTRPIEWSPEEIADYNEIITWASEQFWSNGKIGAWGVSYPGNSAEMMASLGNKKLMAVAPLYDDFDPLMGVGMPGGISADGFLDEWSALNSMFDTNPEMAKPVNSDKNGLKKDAAIASHDNPDIAKSVKAMIYRDDEFGDSGLTFRSTSPYAFAEEFNRSGTPMYVLVSWMDAVTPDGALSRFNTLNCPQQLTIGPWNHGGSVSIDPFRYVKSMVDPTEQFILDVAEQNALFAGVIDFFDSQLKTVPSEALESWVRYYTLNSGEWQTTDVWPPEGFSDETFFFAEENRLQKSQTPESEYDVYKVDFSASSGTANRWKAQIGSFIDYSQNRAEEDKKLQTYTSAPFETDAEITGTPVVTLNVDSSVPDCAFHIYLEDLAPDGTVTYVTEGILRSIHHSISTEEPPYYQPGPYHSFLEKDSQPLTPGEISEVSIGLISTSVMIKKGHSLRIAVAGADSDTFNRYPESGPVEWKIYRGGNFLSKVVVPVKYK